MHTLCMQVGSLAKEVAAVLSKSLRQLCCCIHDTATVWAHACARHSQMLDRGHAASDPNGKATLRALATEGDPRRLLVWIAVVGLCSRSEYRKVQRFAWCLLGSVSKAQAAIETISYSLTLSGTLQSIWFVCRCGQYARPAPAGLDALAEGTAQEGPPGQQSVA